MEDQKQFMEEVLGFEKWAREKGSPVRREDISRTFAKNRMSEDQIEELCRFLEGRGIEISGRDETGDTDPSDWDFPSDETGRDREMVRLYMKEMESVGPAEDRERQQLLVRLISGEPGVRDLLVEAYLPLAAEIAAAYRGRGLLHSDLIQECNLGLLLAVSGYPDKHPDPDTVRMEVFRDYLEEAICSHLEDCLSEYTHSMRSARKMVRQMNRLNETAAAYARDFGREATLEELSDRMGMTEDQVRRLMKSSLDAINASI